MARFGAVLDACILVPVALADTLLRIAEREVYRPLWSDKILEEVRAAVLEVHPAMDPSRIDARLHNMNEAFTDACVHGWERLVAGIVMPDPNDCHVVAAAVRGRAELIVTANLRDFPDEVLEPLGLHALSPDDFLLDQLDLAEEKIVQGLRDQASAARRPPLSERDALYALERAGVPRFAEAARSLLRP